MNVTATEAKNRLGQVLEQAMREPVFIEKGGRQHSVVLSFERYQALVRAEALATAPPDMAERRRRFDLQHQAWIDEQNRRIEERGLWNEEFRSW